MHFCQWLDENMLCEYKLQKESYFTDTNVDIDEKEGFRNLRYHATYQKYKKSDTAYLKQIW